MTLKVGAVINLEIYTDGAYSPLRDQGGVGIVFIRNGEKIYEYSKMYKATTNNRCELSAVIIALHAISKNIDNIIIYSDSQYVINTITKNWKRNKNQDLWANFDKCYKQAQKFCNNISFTWVKGHKDNEWNNLADKLAVEASQEYEN